VPIVLKSESLDLLKPSGPVHACNGIALPLTFSYCSKFSLTAWPLTINYWFPDSLSNIGSLDEDLAAWCSKLYLSFMLTATTAGRAVERSTRCHQGGSDMCPARAVPYGARYQGTRRLPVPQLVHTKGKAAPRRPALLHNIFALN